MTALFRRWLPGLTLLVWSAVLLSFYFTGRIASYIIPAFRTNVLIAGFAMLAMACCFLLLPGVARCCDDERCGHPLGRRKFGRILTFLILILPVTCAAFFSPRDYGLSTFINRVVTTDASGLVKRTSQPNLAAQIAAQPAADNPTEPPLPTKDGSQPAAQPPPAANAQSQSDQFVPKTKEGYLSLQVIDLLYAAQDSSMRADFEGKTIETIGQIMPDDSHNVTGNRFKLMRMFMYCCAADAKPIAALIEAPSKPAAADMAWVRVIGKLSFPIEGGRTVPVLKAISVQETQPPEETMLY
jgi:uncharacterized repeat protein (TIGR03943 family)